MHKIKQLLRMAIKAGIIILPWRFKRIALMKIYKYSINENCSIGLSWVYPDYLEMDRGAKIGNGVVAVHLHRIVMGKNSKIGRGNWITGFPKHDKSYFSHIENRDPSFYLGDESAITKQHHIDCTDSITIGEYSTIAGYYSQLLTHSVNIEHSIQDAKPISIGSYCFIGTNVVILGGTQIPDYAVVGAKSMVSEIFENKYILIAGVPAKPVKELPKHYKYFNRSIGRI